MIKKNLIVPFSQTYPAIVMPSPCRSLISSTSNVSISGNSSFALDSLIWHDCVISDSEADLEIVFKASKVFKIVLVFEVSRSMRCCF